MNAVCISRRKIRSAKTCRGEILEGISDLGSLPLYITILLKLILYKSGVIEWTGSSCSRKGLLADTYEQIIRI
jgi:hypothetical protein